MRSALMNRLILASWGFSNRPPETVRESLAFCRDLPALTLTLVMVMMSVGRISSMGSWGSSSGGAAPNSQAPRSMILS